MKTLRIVFSCGLLLFCLNRVQTVIPQSCTSEEAITVTLGAPEAPATDAAKKWHLRYAKRQLRAKRRRLLREVS